MKLLALRHSTPYYCCRMYGYTGQILTINLDNGVVGYERPESALYRRFLGGRGLAAFYLRQTFSHGALDSAIAIVGFAGALTGTGAPSSDGLVLLSKSPLTGTVGEVLVRGEAGGALRQAGYDGFVITGRSAALKGVEIDRDGVSLVDAVAVQDRSCHQVSEALGPERVVLSIGPAGERAVPIAGLYVSRGGVEGRSGLGAVFGTKNLKYIALRGSGHLPVASADAVKRNRADVERLATASPVLRGAFGIGTYGTPTLMDLLQDRRMLPTDNFRKTYFDGVGAVNAYALQNRFSPTGGGCPSCPVGCRRIDRSGRRLPSIEALCQFTALLENPDLMLAVASIQLCEELGLDPVSVGASLACYQEIARVRLNSDDLIATIEDMALDEGLGIELNEGPSKLAARIDCPEADMTVKGLPLAVFDPRGALGTALSVAVATIGGCPRRADLFGLEVLRKPVAVERFTFQGKARMVKIAEDRTAAADALVVCRNMFLAASLEEYGALLTTVSGAPFTRQSLMHIGARIDYQERLMNHAAGFTAEDDDLPARFFSEPGTSGPDFEVSPIDREAFLTARRRYYRIRGLDEDGAPRPEVAEALELEWNS